MENAHRQIDEAISECLLKRKPVYIEVRQWPERGCDAWGSLPSDAAYVSLHCRHM